MTRDRLREAARKILPVSVGRWIRRRLPMPSSPPVGRVNFGELRHLRPVSRSFGFDRGQPVDRYYIEEFLTRHAEDVAGRVLEIGDDAYTRRFGHLRVTTSDVLHVTAGNPKATMVADLAEGVGIPSGLFDCIILTQTLHFIYDLRAAVQTLHRILRPGGVCLATVPGLCQVETRAWGTSHWGFTSTAARKLFEETFPPSGVQVESHGNVLAACAFLQGLAAEELTRAELEYADPAYQVVITLRAAKARHPS